MSNHPLLTASVTIEAEESIPSELTEAAIKDLVHHALSGEGAAGDWEIAFAFIDEAEMIDLHTRFMDNPDPTDIMTFPYDEDLGLGGDVAICVPVAIANAADNGVSISRELAFLVVHGVLHLLGHDDTTTEAKQAMLDRQNDILDGWGTISR